MSASVDWNLVKEIVADALELDASKREEFARNACHGDRLLFEEVLALLRSADPSSGILDSGLTFAMGFDDDTGFGMSGQTVGRYRVGALIAEGGMGVVYEAEQEQPRRRVALKLMRPTFYSPSALRQFQYEIELLGRLENPAIARIYEAGVHESETGSKTPYFAMEFIKGATLTDYVKNVSPSVTARLQLMAEIADAIQDAHEEGIIHRDLKPQNILVDDSGRPKILDFGIARTTRADDALTVPTMANEVVGTLPYMSPEQTVGGSDATDVRTDVYSLGVILYRILSGQLPLNLEGLSLTEAVDVIATREPLPLKSLVPALPTDIVTIVQTALAKEKERRYGSAAEFAADLRRYLADEPIQARPPSFGYLAGRYVKRHRLVVAASAAVFLAVVGGLIATSIGFLRAADERDAARASEKEAKRSEQEARAAERRARNLAQYLEDLLGSADPSVHGPRMTLGDLLDSTSTEIDDVFTDDLITRIKLHALFGSTYYELGNFQKSEHHLRKALVAAVAQDGEGGAVPLDIRGRLARVIVRRGDLELADTFIQESLSIAMRALGPTHESTLTLRQVANELLAVTDSPKAEEALRQLAEDCRLARGDRADISLSTANDLAVYYLSHDACQEALPIVQRLLAARLAEGTGRTASVCVQLANLAAAYEGVGRAVEAEENYRKALTLAEELFQEDHHQVLSVRGNLAAFYSTMGRFVEALPMATKLYEAYRDLHGLRHEATLLALNNLAFLELRMEHYREAEAHGRVATEGFEMLYGAGHRMTLTARQNWASALEGLGELDTAEAELGRIVDAFTERGDKNTLLALPAENNLAMIRLGRGDATTAATAFAELVATCRGAGDSGRIYLPLILRNLGKALTATSEFEKSKAVLEEAFQKAGDVLGSREVEERKTAEAFVALYTAWGRPEEAARWARFGKE